MRIALVRRGAVFVIVVCRLVVESCIRIFFPLYLMYTSKYGYNVIGI